MTLTGPQSSMRDQQPSGWHLDKRVPAALILTVMIQFVGFVWWAASINERVTSLERSIAGSNRIVERVTRVETQMEGINRQLEKIDAKLDRIAEKR